MEEPQPKIGDIVMLKPRFDINGPVGLVIDIHKAEMLGSGGWTTFDYVVLTASGSIVHISDVEPTESWGLLINSRMLMV